MSNFQLQCGNYPVIEDGFAAYINGFLGGRTGPTGPGGSVAVETMTGYTGALSNQASLSVLYPVYNQSMTGYYTLANSSTNGARKTLVMYDVANASSVQTSRGKIQLLRYQSYQEFIYNTDHWEKLGENLPWYVGQQQGTGIFGSTATGPGAFGNSVAISTDGNTLACGSVFDGAGTPHPGKAFVFSRSGSTWSQQATMVYSGVTGGFGQAVALSSSGNVLAVAANYLTSNGSVSVYNRSGTSWNHVVDLDRFFGTPPAGAPAQVNPVSSFASSCAISADGRKIAAGAPLFNTADGNVGGTWTFTFNGSSWSNEYYLSQNQADLLEGTSLAMSANGQLLVVGAPAIDQAGSPPHIYVYSGSTLQQDITGPSNSLFGQSVALSLDGGDIFIGAPGLTTVVGSVYQYRYNSLSGLYAIFDQITIPSNVIGPDLSIYFGYSISLSGNWALAIGGYGDDSGIGAVWIYINNNGWQLKEKLIGSSPTGGQFGISTAISSLGNTLAVGGPLASGGYGSAWVFI